ncbi:hypothetical protein [Rummeliibacillus sp. POC4]|uniref:hypothetical protein n=1 Tax=Rummeliibacillus sp. POC4 TaxID=2305899 RepID=UPI000E65F696|nr:hypothetical protein [Rummeliibacillus sp. POC4]RIJ69374.1 hypothetical protein D1606_01010 [Rummeliibacillus sp. POC4]
MNELLVQFKAHVLNFTGENVEATMIKQEEQEVHKFELNDECFTTFQWNQLPKRIRIVTLRYYTKLENELSMSVFYDAETTVYLFTLQLKNGVVLKDIFKR